MRKYSVIDINQGDAKIKRVVKIEGDECPSDTHLAFRNLMGIMVEFTQTPAVLMALTTSSPSEVRFWHNGTRWIIEAHAVIDKESHEKKNALPKSTAEGG